MNTPNPTPSPRLVPGMVLENTSIPERSRIVILHVTDYEVLFFYNDFAFGILGKPLVHLLYTPVTGAGLAAWEFVRSGTPVTYTSVLGSHTVLALFIGLDPMPTHAWIQTLGLKETLRVPCSALALDIVNPPEGVQP